MLRRIAIFISILGLVLSGCRSATTGEVTLETPIFEPTGVLAPYYTPTPIRTSPTPTLKIQIPVTPAPTATPFLHTLTNDDTLLGIAYQYGVSLEDLEAANPGINPYYLTVGKQIVIPIGEEITQTLATPTPFPITNSQVRCYHAGDGGLWCVTAVYNDTETSLENISVGIGLYTSQGDTIASEIAYAPLDILQPGKTMPFMAYFSPPLPDEFQAQGEVLSGIAISVDDPRYLDLPIEVKEVQVDAGGKQAVVEGEVVVSNGNSAPGQIWALAVAYDAQGDIMGTRKWESTGETQFEITVYSLAGTVDHVDVLIEAKP